MSSKHHTVTICYGPYLSCATVQHREDYLQGLITVLSAAGHQTVLEKIEDRDVVELVVHGELIFECNIQDLVFGGDGKLDTKCDEALQAVSAAY